jgi:hypothetical protein
MQTVDPTMASRPLIKVGRYHLAALGRKPETSGLVTAIKPAVDALAAARTAREQAEDALIEPRAVACFAEAGLEAVLRDIAAEAHSCDRGVGGDLIFRAIFPDGLDAEVRPRGAAQLAVSTALRGRLASQPAAAPVKARWLEELDKAMAALGDALEARRSGERTLGLARAAEDGARETFVASYDSNAGAIRQMFPRNRVRQNLYFDQFRGGRSSGEDTPEPPPEPNADAK